MITGSERGILREVAKQQLEVANSPKNQETVAFWKRHNALKGERPLIHMEIDNYVQEVLVPKLQCTSPEARKIEQRLYYNFFNLTQVGDDKAVPDYFGIWWQTWFKPFGFDIKTVQASGGGLGHQFVHQITDVPAASNALAPSTFGVDAEATRVYFDTVQDAIGDILPVRMAMKSLICSLTQDLVHLMGMEKMLLSLAMHPQAIVRMMDQLSDDYLRFFDWLGRGGYLLPTTGCEETLQGSLSFTDELPAEGPITGMDQVWGYMDSQETVNVSPKMFAKLLFPAYKKVGERFGLLSYGCCEPVNRMWDSVRQFENLRKVSVSPWADEAFMGEALRGSRTIYHRKPSPNFLGVDEVLDEDAWRGYIAHTLTCAQGCRVEITSRDVYTVHGNLGKVQRAVEIIREEIEARWERG